MARKRPIRARSAIDVVEAAYRLHGSETAWLEALVDLGREDLDTGGGVYAFTGDESVPNFAASPVLVERGVPPAVLALLGELNATAPTAIFDLLRRRLVTCGGLEQVLGVDSPVVAHFRATMSGAGMSDGICLFAQDAQGGSVTLSAPSPNVVSPSPRVRGIWQRVGLHVVAGLRLRRKLAARATERVALLSPGGKIEDATGAVASHDAAQVVLRTAVRAMDRARRANVRSSPDQALALWRGLVAGKWSLVDHWEDGGRRYVAAYANRPGVQDPRALTSTEIDVLRYLAHGATNKEVSYALGLPEKTVSWCVTRIMKKLQVRSRVHLATVLEASRSRHLALSFADETVRVLMTDMRAEGRVAARLTRAERDVAEAVARGWSNARIADERDVSAATVAKQLQSIYDKLGVENRAQLTRALAQSSRANE